MVKFEEVSARGLLLYCMASLTFRYGRIARQLAEVCGSYACSFCARQGHWFASTFLCVPPHLLVPSVHTIQVNVMVLDLRYKWVGIMQCVFVLLWCKSFFASSNFHNSLLDQHFAECLILCSNVVQQHLFLVLKC